MILNISFALARILFPKNKIENLSDNFLKLKPTEDIVFLDNKGLDLSKPLLIEIFKNNGWEIRKLDEFFDLVGNRDDWMNLFYIFLLFRFKRSGFLFLKEEKFIFDLVNFYVKKDIKGIIKIIDEYDAFYILYRFILFCKRSLDGEINGLSKTFKPMLNKEKININLSYFFNSNKSKIDLLNFFLNIF